RSAKKAGFDHLIAELVHLLFVAAKSSALTHQPLVLRRVNDLAGGSYFPHVHLCYEFRVYRRVVSEHLRAPSPRELGKEFNIEFPIVTFDKAARRRDFLQGVGEGASDEDEIAICREIGNFRERYGERRRERRVRLIIRCAEVNDQVRLFPRHLEAL